MISKCIPSTILTGVAELIRERGGDPVALAEQVGLPENSLNDADVPVDVSAVLDLFETAARELDCRNFGMILASRNGLDVFGSLWVLLRSARTVGQMLEDLSNHYDMYTRAATMTLEPKADGASLNWDTVSQLSGNTTQAVEYGFALCVQEFRKLRPDFTPPAVQFRHAPPADLSLHQFIFGQGVSFNQDCNAIHFSQDTLDLPMASANSRSHKLAQTELRRDVGVTQLGLSDRIEKIVRALLPYSPCTVDEVADSIGMNKRSFQERMNKQGTSFKQVKDRVRYDLALKYLTTSSLGLAEISEILGYSELSAFSRSFKRWHGKPASAVRRAADDVSSLSENARPLGPISHLAKQHQGAMGFQQTSRAA